MHSNPAHDKSSLSLQSARVRTTVTIEPIGSVWYFRRFAEHPATMFTFRKRSVVCVALQIGDLPVVHDDKRFSKIAAIAFGSEGRV